MYVQYTYIVRTAMYVHCTYGPVRPKNFHSECYPYQIRMYGLVRTMYVHCTYICPLGKSKGVNMAVCNILFWSIIAPIVTYGSEVWVLQPDEQELLRKFQRYVCRRCQRFPPRSPNFSTTYPMGWMDIVQFINVKKMLFLRTIITMPDDAICKRVLVHKATEYRNDPLRGTRNTYNSPINELLNVSREFGILELCLDLIENGCHLSKYEWKKKVWEIAWQKEDEMYDLYRNDALLFRVIDRPFYLIWWVISDLMPCHTNNCEIMSKLVCNASLLKDHDYRLKRKSFSHKVCNLCYLGVREDLNHVIMQCPNNEGTKEEMLDMIKALNDEAVDLILAQPQNLLGVLMGKHPEGVSFESMVKVWVISSKYIADIYRRIMRSR